VDQAELGDNHANGLFLGCYYFNTGGAVIQSRKKIKWQVWQCFVLLAGFFSLCFMGSDPQAEHAAAQGPTAQERMEIMSRHPVNRAEYEALRIYGWDKDYANNQVIILDKDGEPQLVKVRPR
jgi:hypothetical protein